MGIYLFFSLFFSSMKNFWHQLRQRKEPIACMAPLANVTHAAFRSHIAKVAKPDVIWTEFVSADGLSSERGRPRLIDDLKFNPKYERPIIAQIFGRDLNNLRFTANLCKELDFDGIDLNFGCPDKAILKQKCGAYMTKDPEGIKDVIEAVRDGAGDLPISVKTRLGFGEITPEIHIPEIMKHDVKCLTIHLRTMREMSKVPAHWEKEITDSIKQMRDEINEECVLIGNGDIMSRSHGEELTKNAGFDGYMIGRAVLKDFRVFQKNGELDSLNVFERLKMLRHLLVEFHEIFEDRKSFHSIKRMYKSHLPGKRNQDLRMKLYNNDSIEDSLGIIDNFLE